MGLRFPRFAFAGALVAALPIAGATPGTAQDFPTRPIELIVPWGPGGGADQVARKLASLMEPGLKVSIPVVNVPGATGQTGLTKMLTAPADVPVRSPAFDVTPAELITAIVTDRGVLRPPFTEV